MAKPKSVRDPVVLREWRDANAKDLPLALGLDLGRSTGASYCFFDPKKPITAESIAPVSIFQMDLTPGTYESGLVAHVRLRHFLHELKPAIVFYELVRHTPPGGLTKFNIAQVMAREYPAARFLGSLLGVVGGYCEEHDIPCIGLEIGSIKKRATGKGNANKEDMIRAANTLFGTDLEVEGYETLGTDNMADSAFVLLTGLEQTSYGVTKDTTHE